MFLGQSTAFGLALSSLALLGVGRRGGFYSRIVYTCSLGQLASAKCVFCLHCVFLPPWNFGQKLEDSAPFLRVPLSIVDV